jgi:hypothetical protein
MGTLLLIVVLGIGALVMSSFLVVDNSHEDFGFLKKNTNQDDFFRKVRANAHRIR